MTPLAKPVTRRTAITTDEGLPVDITIDPEGVHLTVPRRKKLKKTYSLEALWADAPAEQPGAAPVAKQTDDELLLDLETKIMIDGTLPLNTKIILFNMVRDIRHPPPIENDETGSD